jgi:chromosomal replication initiation ATPase DnaA
VEHQIELTAESLWHEVAGRLRSSLNETTYGTWFGEARGVALDDGRFVLGVPNDFTRDWIEGHFLSLIGAAIRDVTGEERPIDLQVVDGAIPAEPSAEAPRGARAGGAGPTAIGLRATLLTIGALGLLLALAAVLRSPVRRHVRLPATAEA